MEPFSQRDRTRRAGADVSQHYLTEAGLNKRMRLLGFERLELQPSESRRVTLTDDPRLLSRLTMAAPGVGASRKSTYRAALQECRRPDDGRDRLGCAGYSETDVVATDVKVRSFQPSLRWRDKGRRRD